MHYNNLSSPKHNTAIYIHTQIKSINSGTYKISTVTAGLAVHSADFAHSFRM